nr:MAG TPA: hypothetical protein [Caudoviricetes sp.]
MTNLNIATPIDKKDTNFGSSDILLAKDIVKLANGTNSEDVDKLKTSIVSINEQMAKITNDISTLNSKFTGLFEVVTELPNINDAQLGKIYCIKDTSSSEDDNKYIEWVKIRTADDTYKFEKVGEFKTEPDLSGYAKLDSRNVFNNSIIVGQDVRVGWGISTNFLKPYIANRYLCIESNGSPTKAYVTDGGLAEIGTEEDLTFTLEDGSTVTKKIRVLSSTTTPAT